MQFKDAKIGQTIYVLDRNELALAETKIVNVSFPRIDTNSQVPGRMVVDISIENGSGSQTTFTVPDGSEVAYATNKILALAKKSLTSDVEYILGQSKQILNEVDSHKQKVVRCEELLAELNPEVKEKRETEVRISNLETTTSEIKQMLTDFIKSQKL